MSAAPAVPGPPFECTRCSATFGRLEHFQRHSFSHTNTRPFRCDFCFQSFNRRDALTRHLKICKARLSVGGSIPTLPKKKKGKKRLSCDRCSQLKRACSRTFPCTSCSERNLECSYPTTTDNNASKFPSSDPATDLSVLLLEAPGATNEPFQHQVDYPDSGPGVLAFDDNLSQGMEMHHLLFPTAYQHQPVPNLLSLAWQPVLPLPSRYRADAKIQLLQDLGDPAGRPALRFLSNFIDSGGRGIAPSFFQECGREQDGGLQEEPRAAGQRLLDLMTRHGPTTLDAAIPVPSQPSTAQLLTIASIPSPELPSLVNIPVQPSPLDIKTREIIAGIHSAWASSEAPFPWSSTTALRAAQFFSARNITKFLDSYWTRWHPNTPFVHKPTFDPLQSPAPLLAAMVLIGAAMSNKQDRLAASVFFDVAERWVLCQEDFSEHPVVPREGTSPDFDSLQRRVDALRAAYLVVLVQTWEGSNFARYNTQNHQYSRVISVARRLRATVRGHGPLQRYLDTRDMNRQWSHFALVEGVIRTVTWVFLLDCAYSVFYTIPPRMGLEDASLQLSCPEACYNANDVGLWWEKMGLWASSDIGKRQMTLADAINIASDPAIGPEDQRIYQQMSVFNLFAIINAVHGILSHIRSSLPFASKSKSMDNVLSHWSEAWVHREPFPGLEEPSNGEPVADGVIGFARYAPEYYCLAIERVGDMDRILEERRKSHHSDQLKGRTVEDLIRGFTGIRMEASANDS